MYLRNNHLGGRKDGQQHAEETDNYNRYIYACTASRTSHSRTGRNAESRGGCTCGSS